IFLTPVFFCVIQWINDVRGRRRKEVAVNGEMGPHPALAAPHGMAADGAAFRPVVHEGLPEPEPAP
ncbi:MAG TPA: hypothetical protein VFA26_04720, partial [Gemmataceae bacterium]|nr:hypothetical protein [Gemmataceae bacterium]